VLITISKFLEIQAGAQRGPDGTWVGGPGRRLLVDFTIRFDTSCSIGMPRSIVSAQTHCSASPTGDEIRKAATLPKGKSLICVDYSFAHSLSAGTPSPRSNLSNTPQTILSPKFLPPSTPVCQGDPPQSPVLISDRKYHVDSLGYQKEQNPAQRRRIRKANARKRTQRRRRYVQLAPMP
jgi:hypothetical protein